MFTFATQPLSIFQIVKSAIKLYAITFSKAWYIFAASWALSSFWLLGYAFEIFPSGDKAKDLISIMPAYMLIIISIIGVLISLLTIYFKWVSWHRIYSIISEPNIPISESLLKVKGKYLMLILNQCLVASIALMVLVPFVLPGIFAFILMLFCVPSILFEDKSITSAIKNSFDLAWGHFWRTLAVILIPFILGLCINLFLPMLLSLSVFIKISGFTISLINSFVIIPIYITTILVQFNDLKLRQSSDIPSQT